MGHYPRHGGGKRPRDGTLRIASRCQSTWRRRIAAPGHGRKCQPRRPRHHKGEERPTRGQVDRAIGISPPFLQLSGSNPARSKPVSPESLPPATSAPVLFLKSYFYL